MPENSPSSEEQETLRGLHVLRNYQSAVSHALRDQALPHVQGSDFIELLADDHEQFPSQKITHVYHGSKPADAGTIAYIAEAANPNFPNMLDTLDSQEFLERGMSRSLEFLAAGGNLVIATNHADIRDVAEALAAFSVTLSRTAEANSQDTNFTTLLMLGKLITHLGMYGEPAVDLIGNLCDRQYFSFPRTASTEASGIPSKVIDLYNGVLRRVVQHQLAKGGNLFGIALSGTTDKPIKDQANTIGMGRVSKGTLKLLQAPNTLVVPVAMWRHDEYPRRSVFEIVDVPTAVKDEAHMHRLMGGIATKLSSSVPSHTFEYANAAGPI